MEVGGELQRVFDGLCVTLHTDEKTTSMLERARANIRQRKDRVPLTLSSVESILAIVESTKRGDRGGEGWSGELLGRDWWTHWAALCTEALGMVDEWLSSASPSELQGIPLLRWALVASKVSPSSRLPALAVSLSHDASTPAPSSPLTHLIRASPTLAVDTCRGLFARHSTIALPALTTILASLDTAGLEGQVCAALALVVPSLEHHLLPTKEYALHALRSLVLSAPENELRGVCGQVRHSLRSLTPFTDTPFCWTFLSTATVCLPKICTTQDQREAEALHYLAEGLRLMVFLRYPEQQGAYLIAIAEFISLAGEQALLHFSGVLRLFVQIRHSASPQVHAAYLAVLRAFLATSAPRMAAHMPALLLIASEMYVNASQLQQWARTDADVGVASETQMGVREYVMALAPLDRPLFESLASEWAAFPALSDLASLAEVPAGDVTT